MRVWSFKPPSAFFNLFSHLLRLNAERSVRNGAKAGLIDQLTSNAAHTIRFVFDAHQCLLEVIDEGNLTTGHLTQLFALHADAAIFHGHVACILKITTFILARDQSL